MDLKAECQCAHAQGHLIGDIYLSLLKTLNTMASTSTRSNPGDSTGVKIGLVGCSVGECWSDSLGSSVTSASRWIRLQRGCVLSDKK
jgi:hypothetical protein